MFVKYSTGKLKQEEDNCLQYAQKKNPLIYYYMYI